jgi:membrane protein
VREGIVNLKRDLVPLLKETVSEFQKDEAGQLGAALAYYAMFSIFPLLLLLIAGLGFVLRYWDQAIDVQQQILAAVARNLSPQLSTTIADILSGVKSQAGGATVIGLITLLIGASGAFQQLDYSFNKIWKVPTPTEPVGWVSTVLNTVRNKLFSFGMVLAVGFLLLVSMALSGASQALLQGFQDLPVIGSVAGFALGLALSLLLNIFVFALLFKFLPDTVVYWRDVWLGAVATALVWELGKYLLGWYIAQSGKTYSAYGAVGAVLVLMVWIYFSSQILFLGAEFTESYSRRHGSRAVHPNLTQEVAEQSSAAEPEPAEPVVAASSTGKKVVVATGAGLAVGVLGALIAAIVGVVVGVRRVVGGVAGLVKRRS